KGNVEYFLWMGKVGGDAAEPSEHDGAMEREERVSAGLSADEIESAIARAVQEGPQ
ncbi:MAG: 16S/23S rRNA (cytidine-2'-O)-methyltransferase, partial [Actinobacteria bacterium]|nr:16S/23S rRNA (cytidine-2'-O)-methyltransferase [Actinomycetota bacterium]